MDSLLVYLLVVNVVTFLAFALDHFLCGRFPALDDSMANALVMDVFPVAGGAVGMLVALFVLGGRGRAHRMNKDNVAWWFLALLCLVVWGLVCAVRLGLVELNPSLVGLVSGWSVGRLRALGIYLAVVNVASFSLFAWDKHVSATGNDHGRRLPEGCLLGLCLLGGSLGGLVAVHALRHKTRKWYFVWGLPAFMVLHVAVVLYAHMAGLL